MTVEFDDLLHGLRRQYLYDATFHAFVEVLVRERIARAQTDDGLSDLRLVCDAAAEWAGEYGCVESSGAVDVDDAVTRVRAAFGLRGDA